jgi:hypothetical protein
MVAALTGGVLEAITRIFWERFWLLPHCKPPDVLPRLGEKNLDLYERGVESSYKYVTFYANFAWALIVLILSRLHSGDKPCSAVVWLLAITAIVLLRASHVQWTYFVNYLNKVFIERSGHADKRPPTGNESAVHKGSTKSES